MTFLPIVERELRVRARLKSTYRLRMAGALVAMLVVAFMLIVVGNGVASPGKIGPIVLQMLAWPAFIYCLLEGPRNTADCLSEEKRGGTLGLLFLTDLKGYDVVLGKLIATSLNSFYVLLAVLPLMATPLLLGGVTAGEFWRLALVLVNTLFLSLTIGLCVSAVSRKEQRAWGATLAIIALLVFYPLLAGGIGLLPKYPLVLFSPSLAFSSLDDVTYNARPGEYWWAVVCTHLLSWGLLFLASFLLPRTWQERVVDHEGLKLRRFQWPWKSREQARQKRLEVLERNPVLWLAGRRPKSQVFLWTIVGAAGVFGFANYWIGFVNHQAVWFSMIRGALFWSAVGLNLLLAFWVAAQASYIFADARASGALELLLSTPMTVKEIVQGHFLALRNVFLKPVLALIGIELGLILFHLHCIGSMGFRLAMADVIALPVAGLLLLFFILDLYAAAWFGLWMGLISKKPTHAMTKTSLFVLVLPFLFCGLPCNILWPVIGLVKDLIFIDYARGQLYRRFRAVVTEFSAGSQTRELGTLLPAPAPPPLPPRLPVNP